MTDKLPACRAIEIILERSKGSHRVYQHPDDPMRRAIVAEHKGKDVPKGTLRAINKQAGLTVDEFINLL
jgi:predicted RNA binding protein YcfA (HicA-like mRNA interferase family)